MFSFARVRTSFATLALTILVAASLAGCGGEAAAQAPGQTQRAATGAAAVACDLLTADDAASVLGAPVGDPARSSGGDEIVVTGCDYRTAADAATFGKVSLMLRRAATTDLARREFQNARPSLESNLGATTHDVAGLGDGAFWAEGQGVHQLTVLRGNSQLLITVTNPAGASPEEASVRLANAALPRLR